MKTNKLTFEKTDLQPYVDYDYERSTCTCNAYENGDYCFYADCADGGTYTLELPEKFAGKSFEIIEQYGHVTLPSENVLDSRGAVEIIFADRSGLVIKVNDQGKQ